MKLKRKTKFILALAILLLLPLSLKSTTALAKEITPTVKVNGKIANNHNKLNLDTDENYITLKGNYSGCTLKTKSKKIKLRYWGTGSAGKEWEVVTKKSGKARVIVKRNNKTIKVFTIIVRKPKLVTHGKGDDIDFELKNAGNDESDTLHKIKWTFTPIGDYGSTYKTIKEKHHSAITMIANSGTYVVRAKLLGKTYKLKRPVTILEFNGDFEIRSFQDAGRVLPHYVIESLKQHHYSFSIVKKKTLDKYETNLRKNHLIAGIHDVDERKIVVCNTSADTVIHEIGHFVSCSFQKVNGINLTQTEEWQRIYNEEKNKFYDESDFTTAGDTYAATSANEFFAECFSQYYLVPKTLAKNCPKAYKFVQRTVNVDFPRIAGINW